MNGPLDTDLGQGGLRSFKDILGHERWFEALISNLKLERATHSHQPIALIGLPGVGKRTLARLYAQALLCEQELDARIDAAPCQVCDECRAMQLSSLAFVENDARGDRGDDGERELEKVQDEVLHTLIERDGGLNTAPVRIVVFNNAEEFTSSTADIALKTLEREITHTLYIFIVNDETRFSAALRSRCSVYRVGPIAADDMASRLALICERRSVAFDEVALRAIAAANKGSFGAAVTILARVERHGDVTVDSLIREPEFGWGMTMLACWRAVLGRRRDEAITLFGDVGVDGLMRVAALQAFLVECRIRHATSGLPHGPSVNPALDLIATESWESILCDWAGWSRERRIGIDEAMERALGFWSSVRMGAPWKASFLKGYEVLMGSEATSASASSGGI